MSIPNLFTYATKELSQDAFLCWLMAWAAPQYASADSHLHDCSKQFIFWLLKRKGNIGIESIETLSIKQQHHHIDIIVMVNNEYKILIEDKIHSREHSNQLTKYYECLLNEGTQADRIIPIYFKTGHPISDEFKKAKSEGYSVVNRNDLLNIFRKEPFNKITHPLFKDFFLHLQRLEDEMDLWQTAPVSKWIDSENNHQPAWIGLFSKIFEYCEEIDKLQEHGWDYVPNQNGGFMGYYLTCGHPLHLALQQDQLCIRIHAETKDSSSRANIRNFWYQKVIDETQKLGLEYSKPKQFGNGEYMTVAMKDDGYIERKDNGFIELPKTLWNIRDAIFIIKSLTKKHQINFVQICNGASHSHNFFNSVDELNEYLKANKLKVRNLITHTYNGEPRIGQKAEFKYGSHECSEADFVWLTEGTKDRYLEITRAK